MKMKITIFGFLTVFLFGCSANPVIKPIAAGVGKDFKNQDVAQIWGQSGELGEIYIKSVDGKTVWQQFMNGYARTVAVTEGKHTLELLYMYDEPARYLSYEEKMEINVTKGNVYVVSFQRNENKVELTLENLGNNASCEMFYFGESLYKRSKLTCKK